MDILKMLLKTTDQGKKCVMATVVEKSGDGPVVVGGRLMLSDEGQRWGSIGGGSIEKMILNTCEKILVDGASQLINYDLTGDGQVPDAVKVPMICGGTVKVFFEYFEPKPNVYIFGSGNVGREIIKKIEGIGFKIIVVDQVSPKDVYYDEHHEDFKTVVRTLMRPDAYVVISTGSHEVDYQILKEIVQQEVRLKFLGMLASPKKSRELLQRLKRETDKWPHELYSPIGLNTGGGTPAEIGISVVAQIQTKRYNVKNVEDISNHDLHRNG